MVDLEKIKREIEKTGFVHEHEVTTALEKHRWSVINGKHYVDDVTGLAREIDILAYKTRKVEDVRYYTALIVSCKKMRNLRAALLVEKSMKTTRL